MSYRIVGDSCMELTDDMLQSGKVVSVPLQLHLDDETILDDESFELHTFLDKMKHCVKCPKSSCPSPERFENEFQGVNEVFVVTLSSELSGSYNSAMVALMDFLDQNDHVKIAVIDSKSASCGETLIGKKIMELKESGASFDEVVNQIEKYRDEMTTKFVLNSLDNLHKNGRLTGLKAALCETLNIKPVMSSTESGSIAQVGQARGMKGALNKMIQIICKDASDTKEKVLAIAHCNNETSAEYVKKQIQKLLAFKEIIIVETKGVSSMYANDGGIILAY